MFARDSLLAGLVVVFGLAVSHAALAQQSADEILEQARAKAQEIEKLKRIINEEPDQNVRLAAFDLMINNTDPIVREVALDAGLASADKLLQAAAFKAAIMNLERLHLTLAVDPSASDDIRKKSEAYLAKKGRAFILDIRNKDPKAGIVTSRNKQLEGEITGTHLSYVWGYGKGILELVDDDAVTGQISIYHGTNLQYIGKGKIR